MPSDIVKCLVCGRRLKNPEYADLQVGPTCAKKAGIRMGVWRKVKARTGNPWSRCRCGELYHLMHKQCPKCGAPTERYVDEEPAPVQDDRQ